MTWQNLLGNVGRYAQYNKVYMPGQLTPAKTISYVMARVHVKSDNDTHVLGWTEWKTYQWHGVSTIVPKNTLLLEFREPVSPEGPIEVHRCEEKKFRAHPFLLWREISLKKTCQKMGVYFRRRHFIRTILNGKRCSV